MRGLSIPPAIPSVILSLLEVLFLVNSYKPGPPWSILWEEARGWNFVIKARFFSGGRVEEATPVASPVLVSS